MEKWQTIQEKYANQWVIIGYSEEEYNKPHDSVQDSRLGTVLYADADEESFFENSAKLLDEWDKTKQYRLYYPTFIHNKPITAQKRVGYLKKLD
jgi:hypothetical protein